MKRFFLLSVCLLFLLAGCKSSPAVPVQILAGRCGQAIGGIENLGEASPDYLRYCMGDTLDLFSEYTVLYPFAGSTYKEFGVFRRKPETSKADARSAVENYLAFKRKNWDTRYKGEEFQKVETARVLSVGEYCLYTILGDDERNAVERIFKSNLR